MIYRYAEYDHNSEKLARAGNFLLASLSRGGSEKEAAIRRVENAALTGPAYTSSGFVAEAGEAANSGEARTSDDLLSGWLLEVHSANLLLSSGIALHESGTTADTAPLEKSVREISRSTDRHAVAAGRDERSFTPVSDVNSRGDVVVARAACEKQAEDLLQAIVEETEQVFKLVYTKLQDVDGAKVLDSIKQLGQSVPAIAAAGNLISQGLAKIKAVLDSFSQFFRDEAFAPVKKKITELWEKLLRSEPVRTGLDWIFGIDAITAEVKAALAPANLDAASIDAATNRLADLYKGFHRNVGLLKSLVSAIVVAAGFVGLLHLAVPGLPLVVVGLYVGTAAAAVLVGMDYCDSGHALNFVKGVRGITGDIRALVAPAS